MSGALTVQRFHEVEAARLAGQVEMRERIARWMRETAKESLADSGTRPFAKLFDGLADEIETLEPR